VREVVSSLGEIGIATIEKRMGGLGIMFFYLYFIPVPSLMMSMGYEIPVERSLP